MCCRLIKFLPHEGVVRHRGSYRIHLIAPSGDTTETAAQELQSKCQALEKTCDTVQAEVSWAREEGKLEHLRAVESKHTNWEAREARLVTRMHTAKGRVGLSSSSDAQGAPSE